MTKTANNRLRNVFVMLPLLVFAVGAFFWVSPLDVSDSSPQLGDESGLRNGYFGYLRGVREQIRASDGHLADRYQRLVDSKNIDGLIRFLRNEFTIVPGGENSGWRDAVSERRWGSHAMLRGGVGTPRELADLLYTGLREMGLESRVVAIRMVTEVRNFLGSGYQSKLSLDVGQFGTAIPHRLLKPFVAVQNNDSFWDTVAAAVPRDVQKVKPFDDTIDSLPTVQFTQGEVTHVANLWGIEEQPTIEHPVTNTRLAGETPWVTVKLEVAMADRPDDPITMATARWRTESIAGSQIMAGFAPVAESPEVLFTTPPRQFASFVPVLRLVGSRFQNGGSTGVVADERTNVTGMPFTIAGQIFEDTDGEALPTSGEIGSGGDASKINSLLVSRATAGNYPWIGLEFAALDAAGQPVTRVLADAFDISIDESPAVALMESNTAADPGVLFLLDVSESVADEFRGAAASELVQAVAADVQSAMPGARFRVGLVSGSGASLLSWRDDIEDLRDDVKHFGMGSPLWRAAATAAEASASLVVFITDGHAGNRDGILPEPDIDSERSIRAGPPFVVVGAVKPGDAAGPAVEVIAELSGGAAIPMGDTQRVVDAVKESVHEHLSPYRFWVRADSKSDTHAITVSLAGRDILATTTVATPAIESRSRLPGPVGLYLTLTANGITSQRTLAGHPYRSRTPVTETAATDALFGLFGKYTLFAEAGTPNQAQILDDLITSRLSWQPVVEASDDVAAVTALSQSWNLPRSAFSFNMPLPGADGHADRSRVIDYGLRWWVHARRRVLRDGTEYLRESVDLLPNTRFFSTNPDPATAFDNTLRVSSFLTNIEEARYTVSALSELKTIDLAYAGRKALPGFSKSEENDFAELTSGWRSPYHFVVPTAGNANAGIAVDTSSGTAVGVLHGPGTPNKGAGITEAEANERFDVVDQILSTAGSVGGPPGAWAGLEQAKMDKLRFATILIIRMEPPDLLGMLRDEACSAASDAVGAAAEAGIRGAFGGIGDAIMDVVGEYNDTAEMVGMGGLESPVSIPGCE